MGDLDIYFGRWEIWVEKKMGEPSEKKLGDGRFGEKKVGEREIKTPIEGLPNTPPGAGEGAHLEIFHYITCMLT